MARPKGDNNSLSFAASKEKDQRNPFTNPGKT